MGTIKNSRPTGTSGNLNVWGQTTLAHKKSIIFTVDDQDVIFEGKEILRLKEMLTEWISEKHPEDLL